MKKKLLFSIVIPCYNSEDFISEALESVVKQNCNNYEVVIINDGSTDNSLDRINSFKSKIENLSVISKKNGGIIEARRDGIINSNGEYIVFLDADDLLTDNCLEVFEKNINEYHPDIIRGNYCSFFEDGHTKRMIEFNDSSININDEKILEKILIDIVSFPKYNSVWRQAIKKSIIKYDRIPKGINMGDDLTINYICYSNAYSIRFISDVVYSYRVNLSSICHRKDEMALLRNINDMSRLYSYIKEYSLSDININDCNNLLKNIYIAYLKYINYYFYLIVLNVHNNSFLKDKCNYIFNLDLIFEVRKNIKCSDIKNDFNKFFLCSILKNKQKKYIRLLKFKRFIKKIAFFKK